MIELHVTPLAYMTSLEADGHYWTGGVFIHSLAYKVSL